MEVSAKHPSKEEHDARSLVSTATDAALFPLRIATSPPLLRTYLRTLLLLITSTILFAFAVIAYTSFYYSYIPIRGIHVPVYLQFDHSTLQAYPHGVASIQGLVERQKYDVAVEMTLPRSRKNLGAGNWMLDLEMRGAGERTAPFGNLLAWDTGSDDGAAVTVLAHSRRPVIMTYRSWATEYVHRFLRLPLYLSGFGTESETLRVGMMESVSFPAGGGVPGSLRLEVRSRAPLEVYRVAVHVSARLEGLRWVMYRWRVASAVVFVGLFWGVEMGVLLLTWGVAGMVFASSTSPSPSSADDGTKLEHQDTKEHLRVKKEEDEHFPSLPSHAPLQYHSDQPKPEPTHAQLHDIPLADTAEADDEDEEDDFVLQEPGQVGAVFVDSGVGTGVDSERERERAREVVRRRSKGKQR